MIKAIIVDDEYLIRKDLKNKISEHFLNKIDIVSEAQSVLEGLAIIERHKPDLVFLDISLSDGTGFDLVDQCEYKGFSVIFVTGSSNQALKAIKVGALDYVLKPIDDDEFIRAVDKALEKNKKEEQLELLIEVSKDHLNDVKRKRIILKTVNTIYAVYENDIIYCKSDGNYTTFYCLNSKKIVVAKPFSKTQEFLSNDDFVRCHNSYIVNKEHVVKYEKNGFFVLSKDIKIPVSNRRKDYALQRVFD